MEAIKEQSPAHKAPSLSWEMGTAYDLMMSIEVLHNPEGFGLRPSWAAGVRSRVPASERGVLEDSLKLVYIPLHWIHALPQPKDAEAALWALRQMAPEERLVNLSHLEDPGNEYDQVLSRVYARRAWDEQDLERLQLVLKSKKGHSKKDIQTVLDWWSRPDEFGELYLQALQSYYQEFFAEEEQRIKPALQKANDMAQELAEEKKLPELIEILSQGLSLIHISEPTRH